MKDVWEFWGTLGRVEGFRFIQPPPPTPTPAEELREILRAAKPKSKSRRPVLPRTPWWER